MFSPSSGSQKTKVKVSAGLCSFWVSREDCYISLTFQASRGYLHSLPSATSSVFKEHHSNLWFHCHFFLLTNLTILPPSDEDSCNCIGHTLIIQDDIPVSRAFITPAKSLLPCKVGYSQVAGIRILTSWESITLPTRGPCFIEFWELQKYKGQW